MNRVLEPEIMDDPARVTAYAKADFSSSNRWYIESLIAAHSDRLQNVADIGCGPAEIPVQLVKVKPGVRVTAIDGSAGMLSHARRAVSAAGMEDRITLFHGYVPNLALEHHSFDAVLSKDFLHHLPDPMALWSEIKRLGKPGAAVYVMDLIRPETPDAARSIVERVAPEEDPVLKDDFFASLCAAFTVEEIREQLETAALPLRVIRATDRHWVISGYLDARQR